MVVIDGNDHLIGRQVFKLINAIYQKRDCRFLYFNYMKFRIDSP